MDAVLGRFVAHSPMAVVVRGVRVRPQPTPLDDLFVRTVGHRDDRELLFSACVDLMGPAEAGRRMDGTEPVMGDSGVI